MIYVPMIARCTFFPINLIQINLYFAVALAVAVAFAEPSLVNIYIFASFLLKVLRCTNLIRLSGLLEAQDELKKHADIFVFRQISRKMGKMSFCAISAPFDALNWQVIYFQGIFPKQSAARSQVSFTLIGDSMEILP